MFGDVPPGIPLDDETGSVLEVPMARIKETAPRSTGQPYRARRLRSNSHRGIPEASRAAQDSSLRAEFLNENSIASIQGLNDIAGRRRQTLAQMAIAWGLRDEVVTTALIGASKPEQVIDCAGESTTSNSPPRNSPKLTSTPTTSRSICGHSPRSSERTYRFQHIALHCIALHCAMQYAMHCT